MNSAVPWLQSLNRNHVHVQDDSINVDDEVGDDKRWVLRDKFSINCIFFLYKNEEGRKETGRIWR